MIFLTGVYPLGSGLLIADLKNSNFPQQIFLKCFVNSVVFTYHFDGDFPFIFYTSILSKLF